MELNEDGIKISVDGQRAIEGYKLNITLATKKDIISTDLLHKIALQFFHMGTMQNSEVENTIYLSACNIFYDLPEVRIQESYTFKAEEQVHKGEAFIQIVKIK